MTEVSSVDFTRATEVTPDIEDAVRAAFAYAPWNEMQKACGEKVRSALVDAVLVIIACVPAGPDRSTAIRKIREARMDCMSALTHGGRL